MGREFAVIISDDLMLDKEHSKAAALGTELEDTSTAENLGDGFCFIARCWVAISKPWAVF